MVAQGQGAIAPRHMGTGALPYRRQSLGVGMELGLGRGAQRAQGATRLKQRGATPLGERPKRLAITASASLGHAIESQRWDELGVHGAGDGLRPVELSALLPHITRDELDGRLHCRHHALGLLDALHAALAEPCVRGKGANLRDVCLEISGNELAVPTHPTLKIDTMVVMAEGTEAL